MDQHEEYLQINHLHRRHKSRLLNKHSIGVIRCDIWNGGPLQDRGRVQQYKNNSDVADVPAPFRLLITDQLTEQLIHSKAFLPSFQMSASSGTTREAYNSSVTKRVREVFIEPTLSR